MNRASQILAVVCSLVAVAVTAPAGSAATAVEGTYEYREVNVGSGGTRFPHRYEWSQWFSAATVRQGETLEFRSLHKVMSWGWCGSSDTYDITQTGLNFRTAYSPRGRPHPVAGNQIRLSGTSFRNRAWREQTNCGPPCPDGIGTCPYFGTQYHELTGTVPGSDTASLEPGCYVLETDWEYGPSPAPRGIEQSESGSLPRFCVQAAPSTTPAAPLPPVTPPAPGAPTLPAPPAPPGSVDAPGSPDTTAPRARALHSAGTAGSLVRLRFVVADNSGRTRQQVVVQSGGRVLARINRSMGSSRASQIAFVTYRIPRRTAAALRFCVVAWDPAGNPSAKSCARLTVI